MSTAVNRRALVKGAAWSVPVIALAAAAPQAAASTTTPTPIPFNALESLVGTTAAVSLTGTTTVTMYYTLTFVQETGNAPGISSVAGVQVSDGTSKGDKLKTFTYRITIAPGTYGNSIVFTPPKGSASDVRLTPAGP